LGVRKIKKSKISSKVTSKQLRAWMLGALFLFIILIGVSYKLVAHHSSTSLVAPPVAQASPNPTNDSGNSAKTGLSASTPAPKQISSTSTPTPSAGTASYINDFQVTDRNGGKYIATNLSSDAASGSCSIALKSASGPSVNKTGTIISSGTYLSCDFGGTIAFTGSGTARLVVTGPSGKSDIKDIVF
jgi:hypothetical protein